MLIDSQTLNLTLLDVKLYLVKPDINKTIISRLFEAYNISLNMKLGNVSELSFTIPAKRQNTTTHLLEDNPNFPLIRDRFLIQMKFGNIEEYFTIRLPQDSMTDESDSKTCTCYSLQYELNDKMLKAYTAESYTATEALVGGIGKTGILANTLWTLDYVDSSFDLMFRSLDIPSASVLDSVFQIANTFSAVIVWNTQTRKISLYKEGSIGLNRGLKISYGRYLKSLNKEINSDELCTRLRVYGKNGISVQEVNSTGTSYIEDISYFLYPFSRDVNKVVLTHSNYMSDSLCNAWLDYQALIATKDPISKTAESGTTATNIKISNHGLVVGDYIVNVNRSSVNRKVLTIVDVNNFTVATITNQTTGDTIKLYKNGTFGKLLYQKEDKQTEKTTKENELSTLQTEMDIITDNIDVTQAMNSAYSASQVYIIGSKVIYINKPYKCIQANTGVLPTNTSYWEDLLASKTAKQAQIDTKNAEITQLNTDITNINNSITSLQNTIKIENNLTAGQLAELNPFIIEKETTNEYIDNAHELLNWAITEFEKIKTPLIVLNINTVDLFKCLDKECLIDREKIVLGETITVYHEQLNINIEAKIIEIDIDFESDDGLKLVVSSIKQILTDEEKFLQMINKSIGTSTQVDLQKLNWNGAVTDTSEINALLNAVWDTATRAIQSGVNNSVTVDRRGITITDPTDPLKIVRMTHGCIGISADGGNTFKLAIDASGVYAQHLVGQIIAGVNLTITNESGTFTFDANGATITGANLTIVGKLPADQMDTIVVTNASNGATAFDGTVSYRTGGVPTNNPVPTGITITTHANATINIRLDWSIYTQGVNQADFILLFWKKGTGTPAITDSSVAFNVNTTGGSYYMFEGVSPADTYSFGLAAARRTENGLEIGAIQSPTTAPDWQGVTSGTPNYTGNINGTTATTITTVTTNFNTRNDRLATVPANPTILADGTAVDHTINTDGSADISFEWDFTGTGDAYNIDGFFVYMRASTSATAYTFGTTVSEEQVYYMSSEKRAIIIPGVAADKYYTLGVQVYRVVDPDINAAGILKSSIIQPSLAAENPYRPSASVAFAGDITNTINGVPVATVVANASNGATAFDGTTTYRDITVPNGSFTCNAISSTSNTDGSANITLSWSYTPGAIRADGFCVVYETGTSNPTTVPTTASVSFYQDTFTTGFTMPGVPANKYHSFKIYAFRNTNSGVVVGTLTNHATWLNHQPSSTVNFGGNVNGSVDGKPVNTINIISPSNIGNGSNGAFNSVGNVTFAVGADDAGPVVKQYTSFTLNAGHTMTVDRRSKGLIIYSQGDVTINGTINMNNLAARVTRNTSSLPWVQSCAKINYFDYNAKTLVDFLIPAGGSGGTGGAGGKYVNDGPQPIYSGGAGGSECAYGGSGGGGGAGGVFGTFGSIQNTSGSTGLIGAGVGGLGSSGYNGGSSGYNGGLGGGGIIIIVAKGNITINSGGIITAKSDQAGGAGGNASTDQAGGGGGGAGNGGTGGTAICNTNYGVGVYSASGGGGGGAGGGVVLLMYGGIYINSGTVNVNGSSGGNAGVASGASNNMQGSAGQAGQVGSIFTIKAVTSYV